MNTPHVPSANDMNRLVDEQLAGDDAMLARLREQADEIHAAFDDLLARLRHEIDASAPSLTGAHHLRG